MSKKQLTGQQLYEAYLSEDNEYSQLLKTAYHEIGEELFPLLEKAYASEKKVVAVEQNPDTLDTPMSYIVK